jgi:hypothetical protein
VTHLYVGEERCLLAGGVSVEARAHVLDLHLERLRVQPAPGALEGHMLQEVRRTVGAGKLVPAAGVNPYADGGHPGVGRVGLRDDAEARGERGNARHREAEEGGVVSGAALPARRGGGSGWGRERGWGRCGGGGGSTGGAGASSGLRRSWLCWVRRRRRTAVGEGEGEEGFKNPAETKNRPSPMIPSVFKKKNWLKSMFDSKYEQ